MSDLATFKTTKDDLKLYKATFLEWLHRFGLLEWEVQFIWDDVDGLENAAGAIARNSPGKNATAYLSKHWNEPVTPNKIKRTAVHEFSHLLIADIEHIAGQRFTTEAEIDNQREALARRFENAFYPHKY